jgi:hypothetical protein
MPAARTITTGSDDRMIHFSNPTHPTFRRSAEPAIMHAVLFALIFNRSQGAVMGEPTIEVLGVYRLRVTEDMFREQFRILYGQDPSASNPGPNERDCRESLESVVLIEVAVSHRDGRFAMRDFTQRRDDLPRDSWQSAWEEAFLTADGINRLAVPFNKTPAGDDLRIAFYLHFWDPSKPLCSSYGDVVCPQPAEIPERLEKLVPYELLD